MALSKITQQEISEARKGGMKRKKPKKPKTSSTAQSWKNWEVRYNAWAKDVKNGAKLYKDKQKLIDASRSV